MNNLLSDWSKLDGSPEVSWGGAMQRQVAGEAAGDAGLDWRVVERVREGGPGWQRRMNEAVGL
jgi:uncharacterized protein (DUF4415 family)